MNHQNRKHSSRNTIRVAFRIAEWTLTLFLAAFIIYTLRRHVPWAAYLFFVVLAAVSLKFVHERLGSIEKIVLLYLFVLIIVAFVAGTWTIYRIDGLRIFPDTGSHAKLSKLDPFSGKFLFYGMRTFVTAAVFKIFERDWSKINIFYIICYLSAAIAFMYVVSCYFERISEKPIAAFLLILLFLNQRIMSLWMSTALSEVPSISMTLIVIALFGVAYRYRDAVRGRGWVQWTMVVLVAVTAFLFSGSRDTNNYFLPFLIPFYFLVFKKWRMRIALIVVIATVFLGHKHGMERSPRWKCPLGNVVAQRIIPDERLRRTFQEKYHLPGDEIVMPCSGLWIYDDHPNLLHIHSRVEKRDDWVSVYGLDSYTKFLLTHPRYVFGGWIGSWKRIYGWPLWSYADERIRERMLGRNSFYFLGKMPAIVSIVLLLFGLIFFRNNPLIIFCLLHACVIGIIAYHGDAMEVARHSQQAMMTLRLSLLIFLAEAFSSMRRAALRRGGASPASPFASATNC